jgi:hypothetical protein
MATVRAQQKSRVVTPQTLREAHTFVSRIRPAPGADTTAWRVFHQQSARVYEHVADVDRDHHHEAMYWFSYEQRKTLEITEQATKEVPGNK